MTNHVFSRVFYILLLILFPFLSQASIVGVHDPSIVVAYKDANGNSYPENNAEKSLTKYYYVFGTQFGAAYSLDMINWTYFEPKFTLNGVDEASYLDVFKEPAAWSGHTTNDNVRGNAWAADMIYNKDLKKWCMYYSINGDYWMSSIVMLTADKIDGPYQYAGVVICGGFSNSTSGIGNTDYKKVTGSSTVDSRYFTNPDNAKSTSWHGHYGSSCIDPNVLYDESGQLWLLYGSWSGGLFMVQLDNKTGLRDYSKSYGTSAVWDGTTLKSDPYMGIHVAGGYYVSGEGGYIEYMKDSNGKGYYYLFISYGFYSPEGGYVMRMFRSENITGPYTDMTGDSPLFNKWIFNYGDNLSRGVCVMQNYTWPWWTIGQTAQGHNSALMDEDGNCYLVYHTKENTGTVFHNVEVHPMLFNRNGWPLATPFEYRVGYGQPKQEIDRENIVGTYGVILHNPVDYANLVCNTEKTISLNTDGTISGDYTGTWNYDFANGCHYITLETSAGNFEGAMTEQLMDGKSTLTVAFTSINDAGEKVFWGYRKPLTEKLSTKRYTSGSLVVGDETYSLFWTDDEQFHKDTLESGDFEIEYLFKNHSKGENNWENFGIGLLDGDNKWYVRGDAYSNVIFSNAEVGYHVNGEPNYLEVFQDKEVRVNIQRRGSVIHLFVYADDTYIFSASSTNCPTDQLIVMLGAEASSEDILQIKKGTLIDRETVGTCNADGTYTIGFNIANNESESLVGDFEIEYTFNNYRNPLSTDNWDNYIIRTVCSEQTMLIRADAYTMNAVGSVSYDFSWNWDEFIETMKGATVKMNVTRKSNVITYTITHTTLNGKVYNYTIINTDAPTDEVKIGFTCEESLLDIFKYEKIESLSSQSSQCRPSLTSNYSLYVVDKTLYIDSQTNQSIAIYDLTGKVYQTISLKEGRNEIRGLHMGIYTIGGEKVVIK